jgi:hypothetical protein
VEHRRCSGRSSVGGAGALEVLGVLQRRELNSCAVLVGSDSVSAMRERRSPEPIRSEAEYRAALSRIEALLPYEDADSVAELEALANFVELYEDKYGDSGETA